MRRSPAALIGATLLAACTVGPNFTPPPAPASTSYVPPAETAPAQPGAPRGALGEGPGLRWWTAFGSPEMDALVDRALANNRSLQASDATLLAARQDLRAVAGRRLPQIDANARAEQEEVNLSAFGFQSLNLGPVANPEFQLYSIGGGISYDLDLFGRLRREVEQSAARAEAEQRRLEAAHLALAGQVVEQVLAIAAVRARIATTQQTLDNDQRNLDLTTKRKNGGEGTLTEVLTAQGQLTADRGLLPPLEQQLAQGRHHLALLLGIAPADLGPTDFALDRLVLPADVPVTLPSALVHKRPDILEAEADLHAATAAIGIATARLYPDLTLGANLTQGSPGIDTLLQNAFRGYDVFAGLTVPIFHGGTLKAQREAAVQRAKAANATYQETVLSAFSQVADQLTAMQNDARAVAMQRESVDVANRSLALSRRSFQVGNSGILQVLESERLYQRATSELVTARAEQMLSVARLYVATAGGWTTPVAK